jgi:hypothetical protein
MVEQFILLYLLYFFAFFFVVCRYGMISILAEEINGGDNDLVRMQLAGTCLKTQDWIGKGDHYYKV